MMDKKTGVLVITDHNYNNMGNIISGLCVLEQKIKAEGGSFVWLFTKHVAGYDWVGTLDKVYFLSGEAKADKKLISDIVSRHGINIIHTHFCPQSILAFVKLYCLRHRSVKFIRHMHMLYRKKSFLPAEKAKQFLSFGKVNVACSEMCAETMRAAGIKHVVTVTNGVDFCSLSKERKPHTGLNILMFGYDYKNKGVDLAISAVKKLTEDDVKLLICVAGDVENVKKHIIEDFGSIPDFAEFLPPQENVSSLYSTADIFLSSGSIESFCFAVREALYCGCRTVVSNIPSQIMNSGEFAFKAGDADDLSRVLSLAAKAQYDEDQASENVRSSSVSLEKWADNMLAVYKKALL